MSAHLGGVSLVELVDDAVERLHLLVESPLLLVDERLHVDRRRLLVIVQQLHFVLQTLRHQRDCDVLNTTHVNSRSAVPEMGDRLATIDMGRKVGAAVLLPVGESWSPSNTMSPGSRPTSVPSAILIHPTVWPQYTNVTERQTDNGPVVSVCE